MGAPRGYRCAGHVRRTGSYIDELVTEVIAGRLGQSDALAKRQTSGEASETSGISAAVAEQRGRILRAQRDYDAEVIEGCDLKRVRGPAAGHRHPCHRDPARAAPRVPGLRSC